MCLNSEEGLKLEQKITARHFRFFKGESCKQHSVAEDEASLIGGSGGRCVENGFLQLYEEGIT